MRWYDWLIMVVPLAWILWLGVRVRRYVRGVADYLSAGRCARRYVMCVSEVANALSIIGLVAFVEVQYKTGLALNFWQGVMLPLSMVLGLTGFCYYRFRETRAMSIGQFLELRYSRGLRIFAAALRSTAEVCANMIMPAVGARFFIYLLDLPRSVTLLGVPCPTFMLLLLLILAMALTLIWAGGGISLLITDTFQGMICYPLLCIFTFYVLWKFPWSKEVVPVMADRASQESFLNPYDIAKLRDFNLFALVVTVVATVMHRGSWIVSSGAKSAHEHKMAAILGTWRGSFNTLLYVVIGVALVCMLNHRRHAAEAKAMRTGLCVQILAEVAPEEAVRRPAEAAVRALPEQRHEIGVDAPLSQEANLDTPYLETVHRSFRETMADAGAANAKYKEFKTLYNQLSLVAVMRGLLPGGLLGLFCLLMVLAMLSTDDTRMWSATLTIAQDVVMPCWKKALTPRQHLWMIRLVALGVGVVFFIGSYFMAQLDYINLFSTMVCSMWMGGCGPVILGGLYSRRGTTAAAYTSLITGLALSLLATLAQRNWAGAVYPFLRRRGWTAGVDHALRMLSRPFHPYIDWKLDEVTCPVNSYEFYFLIMMVTLALYCIVAWLTCRKPYNLERMLHRGEYRVEGEAPEPSRKPSLLARLVGITAEYTKGDRAIAWGFFVYSFVYQFLVCFVLVVIWNFFWKWPLAWWGRYFLVVTLVVPASLTVVSMVWFMIGGTIDLRRLFRDLEARQDDPLDDGRVEGNVSLADKALLKPEGK